MKFVYSSLNTRGNYKIVYTERLLMTTQIINHDIIMIFKAFAVNVRQCMKLPVWLQITVGGITSD